MTAETGDVRAAAAGGLALVLLQGVGKVLGFAFVLVATRRLGPDTFGRYAIAASLLVFANFLADFGTSTAVVRLVSRSPSSAPSVLRGSSLASVALGVGSALVFIGFVLVAGYPSATQVDVAIAMAGVPAQSLLTSVYGALDGNGAIVTRSILALAQTAVVALGGTAALAVSGDVRAAVIAMGVAPWAVLAAAVVVSRRRGYWSGRLGFDRDTAVSVLRLALPYALGGAVVALSLRFDVLLLSLVRNRSETAIYELALRIVEALAIVGTATGGPATFLLNRRLGRGDVDGARAAYRDAARFLVVVGLFVSAATVALAGPAARLLFGSAYGDVAIPLAILGAVQWLSYLVQLEGALVNSRDDLVRSTFVAVACLSTTLVLDLVFVPLWGFRGAAVAAAAGISLTALGLDQYHRRTLRIGLPLPHPGALAAFVVAAGAGLAVEWPVAAEAALVVVGFLVTAVATRALTGTLVRRAVATIRPA